MDAYNTRVTTEERRLSVGNECPEKNQKPLIGSYSISVSHPWLKKATGTPSDNVGLNKKGFVPEGSIQRK